VAAALGVKVNISSPSFAIFNVYNAKKRRKFVHADLYRLDGINEIVNTGIEDYLYDKNTLVFIEWGTKLGGYLKNSFIEIDFSYLEDAKRKIVFKSASRYWDKKLEKLEVILKKCR
jgi:tRNA threonylcarbamoyladenosine biosynthesis protein TsaE